MYIYNVTVHVEPQVEKEWLEWMKEVHLSEMIATGKFIEAKLFKVITDQNQGGVSYATQYLCNSVDQYNAYLVENAAALRQKASDRFGNTILAFRTQLEEIVVVQ